MPCALAIMGFAIVITLISNGSAESSQLYYDLVEDAHDLPGGKKKKVEVEESAKKPKAKKAAEEPAPADDTDTLAQDIYNEIEM